MNPIRQRTLEELHLQGMERSISTQTRSCRTGLIMSSRFVLNLVRVVVIVLYVGMLYTFQPELYVTLTTGILLGYLLWS